MSESNYPVNILQKFELRPVRTTPLSYFFSILFLYISLYFNYSLLSQKKIMKKFVFFLIGILGILFFTSCKKNDSYTMLGKWRFSKARVNSSTTFNGQTQVFDTTFIYTIPTYCNFDNNGNIQITCDTCTTTETAKYKVSNNKLSWIYSYVFNQQTLYDTVVYDIQKLTSSELNLYNSSAESDYNSQVWIYLNR